MLGRLLHGFLRFCFFVLRFLPLVLSCLPLREGHLNNVWLIGLLGGFIQSAYRQSLAVVKGGSCCLLAVGLDVVLLFLVLMDSELSPVYVWFFFSFDGILEAISPFGSAYL